MKEDHKKTLSLGNHMRNMVGQPFYKRKPGDKRIVKELVRAMARFSGTCWAPVGKTENGKSVEWQLYLNQCPGACGHVWKLDMADKVVTDYLINEINQQRHGEKAISDEGVSGKLTLGSIAVRKREYENNKI